MAGRLVTDRAILRVAAAAIRVPASEFADELVLSVARPGRHDDVRRAARQIGIELSSTDEHQGFLLSDGSFARRRPALAIATRANQLVASPIAPHIGLFSEDLW